MAIKPEMVLTKTTKFNSAENLPKKLDEKEQT